MDAGRIGFQPINLPGSPKTGSPKTIVEQHNQTISEQVELIGQGLQGNLGALNTSLQQLATMARAKRTGILADIESKATSEQYGNLHSAANKIASYTALVAGGNVSGPGAIAALDFIRENAKKFQSASQHILGNSATTEVATVGKVDAKGPRTDVIEFVDVPAGDFKAGYDLHTETLPAYRISKYPVTNAQYAQFVKETGYQSKGSWSAPEGGYPEGPNSEANHPVSSVTWYDAKAFCEWAGVRLPKEMEWEKAARGTDGRKYPWGNEFNPELLNADGAGKTPVQQFEKANSKGQANVSPYGAVDMVGNVLEWCDDGPARRPGSVLLKGGAFTNYLPTDLSIQPFDAVRHTSETPESSYQGFGFRVCLDGLDESPKTSNIKTPLLNPSNGNGNSISSGVQSNVTQPNGILADFYQSSSLLGNGSSTNSKPPVSAGIFQEDLSTVSNLVQDFSQSAQPGKLKTLQETLKEIAAQVRHTHTLDSSNETSELRTNVKTAMSMANRIANYATLASVVGGPVGISLADCHKQMDESLKGLGESLGKINATTATTATTGVTAAKTDGRSKCDIESVEIPGGTFLFGRDNTPTDLPTYQVSKHPVTNQQFLEFVKDTGYQPEGGWHIPQGGKYPEGSDSQKDHPVVNVSYFDAQAFCQWVGGRLPSEKEWEKSARGTDGRTRPWGEDWRPDSVNHDSNGTISVHEVEKSGNVSPFGVVGTVGNVLQWVDDSTPERPGSVMLKGGAWSNGTGNLKVFNAVRRTTENPMGAYRGFGFRVAWDGQKD